MNPTKYYINLSNEVIILREKKRDKRYVNTDILFTTATSVGFNKLPDGSFEVLSGHWDASFKKVEGIRDKKSILQAMGI